MSCKTCKWLEVEPNKAGKRVVRKDKAYQCGVPIPRPRLPTSVLKAYDSGYPYLVLRGLQRRVDPQKW